MLKVMQNGTLEENMKPENILVYLVCFKLGSKDVDLDSLAFFCPGFENKCFTCYQRLCILKVEFTHTIEKYVLLS